MNDKNVIGGTFEDLNEAVVKPVVDEVGKALEQGVQIPSQSGGQKQPFDTSTLRHFDSAQGSGLSAQGRAETQAKLVEARRKIEWWKKLDEEQKRVRELERQKIVARAQGEQQDKEKQQIKQFEIVKKKENLVLNRAQRKTEIRGGVGG